MGTKKKRVELSVLKKTISTVCTITALFKGLNTPLTYNFLNLATIEVSRKEVFEKFTRENAKGERRVKG